MPAKPLAGAWPGGIKGSSYRLLSSVAAFGLALSMLIVPAPSLAAGTAAPVNARAISNFKVGSNESRFGKLQFLGGMVLSSSEPLFGAISSIRFRADQKSFVAVLDTGHWLTGEIVRNDAGVLSGLSNTEISPMLDAAGREPRRKMEMDAEGLALRNGQAIVSFEQRHRIDVYPDPGFLTSKPVGRIPYLIPGGELRSNGGMEALAAAPVPSPLQGALVVIAEKSVDHDGNLLAAILEGPLKGRFSVRHIGSYDVTDSVFLPGGDLLVLERRFNLAEGVGMRLRRIKGGDIKPGAVVDGEIILEADLSYQIDNMEGIDVLTGPDGSTRLIIVSDDNHSFLQRNLMLEFRLIE